MEIKKHKQLDEVRTPLKYKRLIIGLIFLTIIAFLLLFRSQPPSLDRILNQSDSEIDIAKASLVVAKEIFPDINIGNYLSQLNRMADEIRLLMLKDGGDVNDPEYRIRAINTYLFYIQKISYDLSDFFGRRPENCFLNGILDTRKGACFTMPLLYLCLAQRLKIPIYGVNVPQHFILRYDDGKYRSNIEVTCTGAMAPDDVYIEDFQILTGELKSGVFLRNLSNKQVISNMIEARGNYYTRIKDYDKAIRDLEKAVELNPTNVEVFRSLSKMYRYQKRDEQARKRCLIKCKELGYNFDRKTNEEDLIYINHIIKTAKLQGIDTAELETLRDKESARQRELVKQEELARQNGMELFDPEKERLAIIKANEITRENDPGRKMYEEWYKKYQEQQKAMKENPMPPQPHPQDTICPKCGKRH